MNYIYDIYLNFRDIPYDFYDWNKNDTIIHIKKAPIFLINVDNFQNIVNHNIKLDKNLFKYVHNRTELYKKDSKNISCALFTDKNNIIALLFNDDGSSIKRSLLVVDEELEILDNLDDIDEIELEYKAINKIEYYTETRKQAKIKEYIKNELNLCSEDRLKYIYFECFNKYENNINKIKNVIKNAFEKKDNYQKLYYTFKLTSTNKN